MTSFSTTLAHRPRAHRSHGAHHHHSLKSGSPVYERAERREIELFDLDDLRDPIRIAVKETTCLSHVENFLKRRYAEGDDDDEPVPSEARIIYYLMDERLLGDKIPRNISRLYYRALESDDNDGREGAIRISWGRRLHLDSEQLTQIRTALEKGETIGELRCLLASLLDIEDPKRVVISAHGGLRPGLLQGNNWRATMIKSWLCHKIWIDIAPAYNYLIMKGVNEEYIYHPPGGRSSVDLQTLRHWLIHKLLTNVHCRASSRLSVDSDDFTLVCKGKLLDRRRRISFGQTVDFELARDLEDKFTVEEAWLLPQTTTCVVCSDDKRVSEMPSCITSSCQHEPNTCKECVGQWIASSMDTVAWDRLRCPECSQLLRFEDVQAFAGKETFDRYDNLATKAAVSDIPDFKWCLNPRCQSGQIVRPGCQKVKCHSCKASSCANHDLPWHKGETCKEFDVRNRRQRRGEMASEKKVKEITKACPQCHKDVYKFTGCDHITCVCGHEWCYLCLSTYFHDEQSFLQCKHKADCKYFENPPIYEGGRALAGFLNQPPGINIPNFLFRRENQPRHWRPVDLGPLPGPHNPFEPELNPPGGQNTHPRPAHFHAVHGGFHGDVNPMDFIHRFAQDIIQGHLGRGEEQLFPEHPGFNPPMYAFQQTRRQHL